MNPQREMNPPDAVLTLLDSPPGPTEASEKERRSQGKIAREPEAPRDPIDTMLDDGVAYGSSVRLQPFCSLTEWTFSPNNGVEG